MRTLRSRVFIIQDDKKRDRVTGRLLRDFSDAARFGRLVPLINRDVFVDDQLERLPAIHTIMRAKLIDFNSLEDYVLLTGDPVAIAVAIFILTTLTDRIQLLKWNRETKQYFPVTLTEQRGKRNGTSKPAVKAQR